MKKEALVKKITIADKYHSRKARTSTKAWSYERWDHLDDETLAIAWKQWARRAYKKAITKDKNPNP